MSVRHCLQCAWLFLRLFFALLPAHLIVACASCQVSSACYRKCVACVWHGVGGQGTCLLCIGAVWETKYQLNLFLLVFYFFIFFNQENFQKLKAQFGAIWKWVQVHPFFQPNFLARRKWQRSYDLLVYYYFVISFWLLGLFSCSDSSLLVMLTGTLLMERVVYMHYEMYHPTYCKCCGLILSVFFFFFSFSLFSFSFSFFFKWSAVWCHWSSFI